MNTAKGTFTPNLSPVSFFKSQHGCSRMTMDKQFVGDLSGQSYGEMLSSIADTDGNAGYVAIERFSGKLDGKEGEFCLMHYGRMEEGKDSLILQVVADTGTLELKGLIGSMAIDIDEAGTHHYEFTYQYS